MKRVFLMVLDSLGIGAAPDCERFGDGGTNTLRSCADTGLLHIPNLIAAGLGNIDGVDCLPKAACPKGAYCRMQELSAGKDTTVGHWELAGVVSPQPLPTYPHGFPEEVLTPFREITGRGVLCNAPISGTDAIRIYGEEHLRTGDLIVYTSADSVFQIAAHEEVVPPEQLWEYCRQARALLTGKHGVGRVIARPFTGVPGTFVRTANRHDFSLMPPGETLPDKVKKAGLSSIGVGKIRDIFAGRGLTEFVTTVSNRDGMEKTARFLERDFSGLCFVNLVDFDMLYGHRRDPAGYARALNEFDRWLGDFLPRMGKEDILLITADHGCDPGFGKTTDHTREYVPLLILGQTVRPENRGTKTGFAYAAAVAEHHLEIGG